MKWFKHLAAASADDKLVCIRARFGLWGIGAYWMLAEAVCEQMKPQNPKAEASLRLSELAASFGCKRTKLKTFLEHLQNVRGINYSLEGDLLKIEMPRLLKSLDNYSTDFQVASKKIPRHLHLTSTSVSSQPPHSFPSDHREGEVEGSESVNLESSMFCKKHQLKHAPAYCPECLREETF